MTLSAGDGRLSYRLACPSALVSKSSPVETDVFVYKPALCCYRRENRTRSKIKFALKPQNAFFKQQKSKISLKKKKKRELLKSDWLEAMTSHLQHYRFHGKVSFKGTCTAGATLFIFFYI